MCRSRLLLRRQDEFSDRPDSGRRAHRRRKRTPRRIPGTARCRTRPDVRRAETLGRPLLVPVGDQRHAARNRIRNDRNGRGAARRAAQCDRRRLLSAASDRGRRSVRSGVSVLLESVRSVGIPRRSARLRHAGRRDLRSDAHSERTAVALRPKGADFPQHRRIR